MQTLEDAIHKHTLCFGICSLDKTMSQLMELQCTISVTKYVRTTFLCEPLKIVDCDGIEKGTSERNTEIALMVEFIHGIIYR